MDEENKKSSIASSQELKNALKDIGKMGENYEEVIWKLIKYWKTGKKPGEEKR